MKNYRFFFLNHTAYRLLNTSESEAVGKNLYEICQIAPHNQGDQFTNPIFIARQKKEPQKFAPGTELSFNGKSGIQVSGMITPLPGEDGEPHGFLLAFHNLVGFEQQYQECIQWNQLYQEIARYNAVDFFLANPDGTLRHYTGNKENWPLTPLARNLSVEDAQALNDDWKLLTSGKIRELVRVYHVDKENTPAYFRLRAIPQYDANEQIISCYGSIQEITAEYRIRQSQLKGRSSNHLLSESIQHLSELDLSPRSAQMLFEPLSRFTGANRIQLLKFDENFASATLCLQWPPAQGQSQAEEINMRDNADAINQLLQHQTVSGTDTLYLPNQQNHFQTCLGIWNNAVLWGMLVIDFPTAISFQPEDQEMLNAMTGLLAAIVNAQENTTSNQQQNQLLDSVMASDFYLFMLFTPDRRLRQVNTIAAKLLGCSSKELLLMPAAEASHLFAPDQPSLLDRCIATGKRSVALYHFNGHALLLTVSPIRDHAQNIIFYLESGLDVTQWCFSNELTPAPTHQSDAMIDQNEFIENICLKLRHPLNAVISFGELLGSDPLPSPEQGSYLAEIMIAGNSIKNILDRLQIIASLNEGVLQNQPGKLKLEPYFQELCQEVQELCNHQEHKFIWEALSYLPTVEVDGHLLKLVLRQLLEEEIGAGRQATITLTANYLDQPGDAGILELKIRNTVPIIHDEADSTSLGLSRKLLKLLNGTLATPEHSEDNTVFVLNIPVKYAAPDSLQPANENEKNSKDLILVVDDHPANVKLLSAMLNRLGVNYVTTHSAPIALEIAKSRDVTLVLTDVWMEVMTGDQLAEALANNPGTSSIPVVAITADTQVRKGKYFKAVLYKPIKLQELTAVIKNFCSL